MFETFLKTRPFWKLKTSLLTLAVIIVRAIDVILTEAKSSWVMERNSETTEIKAVAVISSVPELDPPDITVVNVSVTLVTACNKTFLIVTS